MNLGPLAPINWMSANWNDRPPVPQSMQHHYRLIVCAYCKRGRSNESCCPGCGATETKVID
jgi:hypothetical protein